jgi:hypothetical protein
MWRDKEAVSFKLAESLSLVDLLLHFLETQLRWFTSHVVHEIQPPLEVSWLVLSTESTTPAAAAFGDYGIECFYALGAQVLYTCGYDAGYPRINLYNVLF